MRTSRRCAILAATVASAMSLASILTPAPASAAPSDPDGRPPLTSVLQPGRIDDRSIREDGRHVVWPCAAGGLPSRLDQAFLATTTAAGTRRS